MRDGRGDEAVPGHLAHRSKNLAVLNPARKNLFFHHAPALTLTIIRRT
jgi:hypothetical protein